MSLTHKSLSALLWSSADILLRQGLSFVVSICLARLLIPEELGTIGLLCLFTGIAGAFVDSGLSAALIQRQDITHTDESTVFWFNLAMGLLVTVLLWILAPVIAHFYEQPALIPITQVLALNILGFAAGSIHATLLTKRLEFRTLLKIGAIATVLSGSVSIIMAAQGFGVWALVAQILIATGATTFQLWIFNRWRPALIFNIKSVHRLFNFGGYLLATSLLNVIYSSLFSLLIGKIYGVRNVGLYGLADNTQQFSVGLLSNIVSRVVFPLFSAVGHDKAKLRRGTRLVTRNIMFVSAPMMFGLAVVAEPFILTLFGERWLPVVPIFQVLCLGSFLWPLHAINLNVLLAQGHSNLYFKLEIIKKVLGCSFLFVAVFFGAIGIAWSQAVFNISVFIINAYYIQRHLGYGFADQIRDIFPSLSVASIMAWITILISYNLQVDTVFNLIILLLFECFIYLSISYLAQLIALREIINFFQPQNHGSKSTILIEKVS